MRLWVKHSWAQFLNQSCFHTSLTKHPPTPQNVCFTFVLISWRCRGLFIPLGGHCFFIMPKLRSGDSPTVKWEGGVCKLPIMTIKQTNAVLPAGCQSSSCTLTLKITVRCCSVRPTLEQFQRQHLGIFWVMDRNMYGLSPTRRYHLALDCWSLIPAVSLCTRHSFISVLSLMTQHYLGN